MLNSIGNTALVRCREVVRFSEGPLSEARLYLLSSIVYAHTLSYIIFHIVFLYLLPSSECCDVKRGGKEGKNNVNIIMTLIFPQGLWIRPLIISLQNEK